MEAVIHSVGQSIEGFMFEWILGDGGNWKLVGPVGGMGLVGTCL
jgi:hypothetical protein